MKMGIPFLLILLGTFVGGCGRPDPQIIGTPDTKVEITGAFGFKLGDEVKDINDDHSVTGSDGSQLWSISLTNFPPVRVVQIQSLPDHRIYSILGNADDRSGYEVLSAALEQKYGRGESEFRFSQMENFERWRNGSRTITLSCNSSNEFYSVEYLDEYLRDTLSTMRENKQAQEADALKSHL